MYKNYPQSLVEALLKRKDVSNDARKYAAVFVRTKKCRSRKKAFAGMLFEVIRHGPVFFDNLVMLSFEDFQSLQRHTM